MVGAIETEPMTRRSFPTDPIFADPSERLVWNELLERLPDEAFVICNLKLLDHSHEYEMGCERIPLLGRAIPEAPAI